MQQIGINVVAGVGGTALGAWTLPKTFSKDDWKKALPFIGTIGAELLVRYAVRDASSLLGRVKELQAAYIVPAIVVGSASLFAARYLPNHTHPSKVAKVVTSVLAFAGLVVADLLARETIKYAFPPLSRIGRFTWTSPLKAMAFIPVTIAALHLSSRAIHDTVDSGGVSEMHYNSLLALLPTMCLVFAGRAALVRIGKQMITPLLPAGMALTW